MTNSKQVSGMNSLFLLWQFVRTHCQRRNSFLSGPHYWGPAEGAVGEKSKNRMLKKVIQSKEVSKPFHKGRRALKLLWIGWLIMFERNYRLLGNARRTM